MVIHGENEQNNIDLDKLRIFRKQEFNKIYQSPEGLVKVFDYVPNKDLEIVLRKLRELNLRHFYEIIELLYKDSTLCGYLMKKYRSYPIDILEYPSNYVIENFNEIFEDLMKLSDEHILARDLSHENSVFNTYDVTIIDADDYLLCDYAPYVENGFGLNCLFKEIFINSIIMYHPYLISRLDEIKAILSDIFGESKKPEGVQRKLSRYKYPIDFINDHLDWKKIILWYNTSCN